MVYKTDVRDGLVFGVLVGFILQWFFQKHLEIVKAQTRLRVTSYLENEFVMGGTEFDDE